MMFANLVGESHNDGHPADVHHLLAIGPACN